MKNASGIKIITNSSIPENTIMIRGEIQNERNNISIVKQKPRFSDTHKGSMVYIENELVTKLDNYSENKKGMKSLIVNEALRLYFKQIKNE